jgi:hypothetical protein
VTFTRGHPPPHALRLLLGSHRGRRPDGRHRAALVTGERCRSSTTPASMSPSPRSAPRRAHRRRRRSPPMARRCNELAAELIRDRPDRFGGFAYLPLPDVDGALAELAYALDDLQLDGVLLFGNARGVYLGDSEFTLLFDELQRRAAVVLVHPNPSPTPSAHALGLPDTLIDFTTENTRAIAQLHYSSTFARTPTPSTSSPAPEVPCPTWPGGSASSTRCASSPAPRAARPRPKHSAACTGIPRRRGNRPRRIRHLGKTLPFPKSNRASGPGTSWRLRPGGQGSLVGSALAPQLRRFLLEGFRADPIRLVNWFGSK